MREKADSRKIQKLIQTLGRLEAPSTRLYFTGGATAVLLGWRDTTIDVDLRFVPESEEVFQSIPRIKESLRMNVELAWPPDFIPELPGWRERCLYITREGQVSFFHYDLYSQALSKIERGHRQDVSDVKNMIQGGWVEPGLLPSHFAAIKGQLYRYPAIDPETFRQAVEEAIAIS